MHSFVCVFIGEKMTEQTTGQNTSNPLQKYFRQPKLHVRLPSGGKYYPPGALDLPESGEVAIYPLTAKDELLLKTPDSLMNGTATADVIKSCVPAIKNPWYMPSLDVDALRTVAKGVNKFKNENNSVLIITHYQRLLNYIKPDVVHLMIDGKIVESGDMSLVERVEKDGYSWLEK